MSRRKDSLTRELFVFEIILPGHSRSKNKFTMVLIIGRRIFIIRMNADVSLLLLYGHTYSNSSMDQPGMVASPARGLPNREK